MNQASLEHPAASRLAAFVSGRLGDAESVEIEAHLADCEVCCAVLEKMPLDSLSGLLQPSTIAPVNNAAPEEAASHPGAGPGSPGAEDTSPPVPAGEAAGWQTPPELAGHPRYLVRELLGAGGMGAVYKAEHRRMERLVALKVINPRLVNSPAAVERFRREVKAAARLAHPNIVTAYDADQAGDVHFLVMEFVEGQSLAQTVAARGPLPVRQACEYARQAALALQHACDRQMVHRDIKPHNLMVTPQGQVKILDFGLARFVRESAPSATASQLIPESDAAAGGAGAGACTGTGQVMGTAGYIAPEQVRDAHQADIRSDIYSLGCTLYYLLAGHSPFAGGSVAEKLAAHAAQTPAPLAALRTDVPAELGRVIERMIAKDPARRFQTPAEAAKALAPFATGSAPARPRRRLRMAVGVTLFAALCLAGYQYGPAVYRFATNQGELVIQVDDKDVEVVVKEKGQIVRVIDTKSKKEVTLRAGKYEIELTPEQVRKGLRLETDRFTLQRGGRRIVKVFWKDERGKAEAERNQSRQQLDKKIALLEKSLERQRAEVAFRTSEFNRMAELERRICVGPGLVKEARQRLDLAKAKVAELEAELDYLWGLARGRDKGLPEPRRLAFVTPWRDSDDWVVKGQELHQRDDSSRPHLVLFGNPAWSDYDYEVEAKAFRGDGEVRLPFRASGPNDRLNACLGSFGNTRYAVFDLQNENGARAIGQVPGRIDKGLWYRVRVRARGNRFQMFLDGKLLMTVFSDEHPRGCVGLMTYGGRACFRNIKVTDPNGKVLLQGVAAVLPKEKDARGSQGKGRTGEPSESPEDRAAPGPKEAAAFINKLEKDAEKRRAAVRFLGAKELYRFPEAEAALITALRTDRIESVRLEAARALGNENCWTWRTVAALRIAAAGTEEDGNHAETSARVRAAARASLEKCKNKFHGRIPTREDFRKGK